MLVSEASRSQIDDKFDEMAQCLYRGPLVIARITYELILVEAAGVLRTSSIPG